MTPADRWSCASLASFAFGVGVMAHASLPSIGWAFLGAAMAVLAESVSGMQRATAPKPQPGPVKRSTGHPTMAPLEIRVANWNAFPSRVTVFGPSEVVTYVPEQAEAGDD